MKARFWAGITPSDFLQKSENTKATGGTYYKRDKFALCTSPVASTPELINIK